jgi:hypothetical protein
VASFKVPYDLGDSDSDRDDALGDLFMPINRFVVKGDATAPVDQLFIPETLREIGLNVMSKLPDHKANVVLIGSAIWEKPDDANWSFRSRVPSDSFLCERGGEFGLVGQESILTGARVSLLYTDDTEKGFEWESSRQLIIAFWGKSIVGRGGHVGAIKPFDADGFDRLMSSVEDPTPYAINPKEKRFLHGSGTEYIATQFSGKPPAKKTSATPSGRPKAPVKPVGVSRG